MTRRAVFWSLELLAEIGSCKLCPPWKDRDEMSPHCIHFQALPDYFLINQQRSIIPALALVPNLFCFLSTIWTQTLQPKILKWPTNGFTLTKNSLGAFGHLPTNARLHTSRTVYKNSAMRLAGAGAPAWMMKTQITLLKVGLFHSRRPHS